MSNYYVNRSGGLAAHVYFTPLAQSEPTVIELMSIHQPFGRGPWLKAMGPVNPGDPVGPDGGLSIAMKARNK